MRYTHVTLLFICLLSMQTSDITAQQGLSSGCPVKGDPCDPGEPDYPPSTSTSEFVSRISDMSDRSPREFHYLGGHIINREQYRLSNISSMHSSCGGDLVRYEWIPGVHIVDLTIGIQAEFRGVYLSVSRTRAIHISGRYVEVFNEPENICSYIIGRYGQIDIAYDKQFDGIHEVSEDDWHGNMIVVHQEAKSDYSTSEWKLYDYSGVTCRADCLPHE